MYRRLWRLAVALLLFTSCYPEPRAGGRPGDVVSGEGVTRWDIFSVDVHTNDDGAVTGYFQTRNTTQHQSFVIEGPAACLNVVGNRATVGGVIERLGGDEFPNPSRYRGWLLYVEDNAGRGAPDKVSHQYVYQDAVTKCPMPLPALADLGMIEGDVSVIEGPR